MTKKHFQMIANVVREATYTHDGVRAKLAESFAAKLAAENPRFDAARFYAACGVSQGPK
jgi:hypothetical protein